MRQRQECRYCGALADTAVATCALCGRPLEGSSLVDSATHSELFLNADEEIVDLTPHAEARPLGFGVATWTAVLFGAGFIALYPWLLAWHSAQVPGSVAFDLTLAVCWLLPELYLVSGMVHAAHRSNSERDIRPGLVFVAAAVALQLVVAALVRGFVPTASLSTTVFALKGRMLHATVPILLYAVGSSVAALAAAWLPRVVPGKFERVIAPQLGCVSVLLAALLLPTWGGIALLIRTAGLGIAPFWIDLVAVFAIPVFALFWFWPHD